MQSLLTSTIIEIINVAQGAGLLQPASGASLHTVPECLFQRDGPTDFLEH